MSRRFLMDSSSACSMSARPLRASLSLVVLICVGCTPFLPNRIHPGSPVALNQVRHPRLPVPELSPRHPRPCPKLYPGAAFAYPGISKPAQYPALRPVIDPIPRGPVPFPRGIACLLSHSSGISWCSPVFSVSFRPSGPSMACCPTTTVLTRCVSFRFSSTRLAKALILLLGCRRSCTAIPTTHASTGPRIGAPLNKRPGNMDAPGRFLPRDLSSAFFPHMNLHCPPEGVFMASDPFLFVSLSWATP